MCPSNLELSLSKLSLSEECGKNTPKRLKQSERSKNQYVMLSNEEKETRHVKQR